MPRESTADQLVGTDELVRLLLDSTAEGIYGIDLTGNCTFANKACLEILGFPPDADLIGANMHDLIHHTRPDGTVYPEQECRIYQALRQDEGTHVADEVLFRKDGGSFPTEYWSYPVFDGDRRVGAVVTFVDITERLSVEEDLRERESLVRLLLNSTGEGIYGIDLTGACTFANKACLEILDFPPDADLIGANMHDLIHHTRPDGTPYPEQECQIYLALRQDEGTHIADEVLFRKDGSSFPTEYRSYPVFRGDKRVGAVVTFVDITERLRVQEELRQTEKMAALGQLSAGVAHELNNPAAAAVRAGSQMLERLEELRAATIDLVTADVQPDLLVPLIDWYRTIRERAAEPLDLSPLEVSDREEELTVWLEGRSVADAWMMSGVLVAAGVSVPDLDELAERLPDGPLAEALVWLGKILDADELAGTVVASSRRISDLVGAVKSYSHMDQAPPAAVNVHEGIEDTLTILGHKLKQGVAVTREFDRSLPMVDTRGSELNQVWTNLIDNAVSAMDGKGTITIRTSRDDEFAVVEVVDDGPGIPPEVQSKVFDPFFTTKDVGEGTGLGLDVVRRIVNGRCGGAVDFDSRPGETRFRVRLPLDATSACEPTAEVSDSD